MQERINELLLEISERLVRVETKIDGMQYLHHELEEAKEDARQALQLTSEAIKRLEKQEDNQNWLWRTLLAAWIVVMVNWLWQIIQYR